MPDGWGPPKELPPQVEADSLAIDLTDGDNSQASVNVIRVPGSDAGTLDDAESGAKKNMDVGGSTDVSINDRVSVDGAESVHVTSTQEMGNQKNITEQFLMLHGENAYGVTFAFHTKVPAKERADVTGAVLASWTWTD